MNIERMKELREFISKLPEKACDMSHWLLPPLLKDRDGQMVYGPQPSAEEMAAKGFECGTSGCFGGWTRILMGIKGVEMAASASTSSVAQAYLELSPYEATHLFYGFPQDIDSFTGKWKTWMLRRLDGIIERGEIRPIGRSSGML